MASIKQNKERNLPATAGRFLTESELRAYTKCNRLFFYGGEFSLDPVNAIVRSTIVRLTAQRIRKEDGLDTPLEITKAINRCIAQADFTQNLLEQQSAQLSRRALYGVNDILLTFRPVRYLAISSGVKVRIKVSKTPIDIYIPALYRCKKNKVLHYIDIVPNIKYHTLKWDIPTYMKIAYLKKLLGKSKNVKTEHVVGHIFHVGGNDKTSYIRFSDLDLNPQIEEYTLTTIQAIESYDFRPLVPCPYNCAWARQCSRGD